MKFVIALAAAGQIAVQGVELAVQAAYPKEGSDLDAYFANQEPLKFSDTKTPTVATPVAPVATVSPVSPTVTTDAVFKMLPADGATAPLGTTSYQGIIGDRDVKYNAEKTDTCYNCELESCSLDGTCSHKRKI